MEANDVGIVVLGSFKGIREGDTVKRTGRIMEVPVGDALIGRVVNPLGQPIDGLGEIKTDKTRPVEHKAPGVMDRQSVTEPLQTGIKAIDALVPIGRGNVNWLSVTARQVRLQLLLIRSSTKKVRT